MIARLRRTAMLSSILTAMLLCFVLAAAASPSFPGDVAKLIASARAYVAPQPELKRVAVQAERDVVILPNDAPTLWVGKKIARAERSKAPDWVAEALEPKGPLPIAAALSQPFRVVELSTSKRYSPLGAPAPDGLVDLAKRVDGTAEDAKTDPAVAAAIDDAPAAPAPTSAPKPALETADAPKFRAKAVAAEPAAPAARAPNGRVIIVLTAVGVNPSASRRAIRTLPREIAIAVAPIAKRPGKWVRAARKSGRIVLAEVPMEPENRRADPGPLTLRSGAEATENLTRLATTLKRLPGVDGVATYRGGRFTADADALRPVLAALQAQSLFLVETSPGPLSRVRELSREIGLKTAASVVSLDKAGRARDISDGLALLEAEARRKGRALGVAVAIPSTIRALKKWAETAPSRGIKLTPLRL
ncbi:MAG: divergent polysaccharide deacetylase family protein [Neomegalonema sp.]|nr:divergent polysaccharide deacetylase family protein [Neomegalonema sp.]